MYNTSVVWTSWDGVWKIKYRDRETAREKEEEKNKKILFYFIFSRCSLGFPFAVCTLMICPSLLGKRFQVKRKIMWTQVGVWGGRGLTMLFILWYALHIIKIRRKARSLFPVLLVCSETGLTVTLYPAIIIRITSCQPWFVTTWPVYIYIYIFFFFFFFLFFFSNQVLPLLSSSRPHPSLLPLHPLPTPLPALPFRPMLARLVVTLCWDCLHVQWCGRWNTRNAYNYSPWWAGVDFTNRNRCKVCHTFFFFIFFF